MTMRYIKTKNGIIAFGREYAYPTRIVKGNQHYIYAELTEATFEKMKDFNRWNILAEADTIEELCDGFYLDDGQEEFCLDDVFTNFDKFKSSYIYNNKYHIVKYEGYGFIKTSKGLIYVAKMNDEGKLCLI